MSLILVVEQDGTYTERIQGALSAEGWTVQVVGSAEQAKAAAAKQRPDLVVVSTAAPGFPQVVGSFGRASGGPGAMALTDGDAATPAGSDGALAKPFTDEQLRVSVRRVLSRVQKADAEAAAARAASTGAQLTSQDLFGDLLAEVEEEAAAKPRPAATRESRSDDALEKQLQQTLSGVLGGRSVSGARPASKPAAPKPPAAAAPPAAAPAPNVPAPPPTSVAKPQPVTPAPAPVAAPPRPAPAPPAAAASVAPPAAAPKPAAPRRPAEPTPEVEDLLSQTLSGLGVGARPRPKAAPPREESRAAVPAVERPPVASPPEPLAPSRAPASVAPSAAAHAEVFGTQRVEVVRPEKPAPPSVPAPAPAAAPGQFGQYALLERVALGGMAEVWKARMKGMEGFQKTVAIKKILPHLTDSVDFVTMFIDEAKLAAQLNHPNIIHIYDLGKLEDDYYIAMEYVEGKDLRSILNTARKRELPIPTGMALLVAARLASALDYAHRKRDFDNRELGLVHRDVSPQNVLISYEGDIKLCDFGIVKAVAKASKTQMGALKGKLQYMSPEQAWGRVVDARSDIFSLGSCLFEMLTGRRLFAGDSEISVLEAVRECRIQKVRDLEPGIPEAVDAVVQRALAKDPDDRYQTAGEMQKELEAVLYTFKPTPDQGELAAYMHRLFGAEAAVASPQAAVAATSASAAPASSVQAPAVVPLGTVTDVEEGGRPAWLVPAIAAAVILVAGVVFFLARGASAPPATQAANGTTPPAAAAATTTGAVAPAALPAATTTTTTAADFQKKLDAQLAAKEEQLKAQLAEQRQKVEAELKAQQTAAPAPAAAVPSAAPKPAAAPPPAPTQAKIVEQPAPPPPQPEPQKAVAPVETPAAAPPPAPAPVKQAEPEKPAAPAVSEGDLIAPGTPGLVPPSFVSVNKPEYPALARRLGVQGTVLVSVLVDETGAVAQTRLVRGVPQNVGLNEAAVAAARTARYRPASLNGVRVKTWANLSIPFKL